MEYPLVMTNIAMDNHHFSWENPLFLWPFSIAMLVIHFRELSVRLGTELRGRQQGHRDLRWDLRDEAFHLTDV